MDEALVDLNELDVWLAEYRELHRAGGVGSGRFSRSPKGSLHGLACADFAVVDYTVGPWPLAPSEQESRVNVLQDFQSAETGLFESTKDKADPDALETTSYFCSALELLGARPLQPMRAFDDARSPEGIDRLLEGVDWSGAGTSKGGASGRNAGCGICVASCFAVTGDVGPEWFTRFFAWLDREADPETGYWRKGASGRGGEALASAYQCYALYDRFRMPLPHPDEILKATVTLQGSDGLYEEKGPGWQELRAAYALDRASRRSANARNRNKARSTLQSIARASAERFGSDSFREQLASDTHRLAGAVSLFAVLSQALPGSVRSRRPLRFYLDRHLFV